jgi:hypothetical protein
VLAWFVWCCSHRFFFFGGWAGCVWSHRGLRKLLSMANWWIWFCVSVYRVGVDGFPPPLRSWCGYRLPGLLWGHSVARAVAWGVVAVSFGAVWTDTVGFVPGLSDSIGSDGCVWAWIDPYLTPLGCGCRCDTGRNPGIGWDTWGPDSGNPSPDAVGNRSMARTISQGVQVVPGWLLVQLVHCTHARISPIAA